MKKKSTRKPLPTPEYDSERETRVLLEDIGSDVEKIAGQVASNSTKLDRAAQDTEQLKDDMVTVKVAVRQNATKIKENSDNIKKIDKKLDIVITNHEHRITKFEAVR